MAVRFPGARNLQEFWELIESGRESIETISESTLRESGVADELLRDDRYVRRGGFVEDKDRFDAAFFGITPHDAEIIDPQQRVFLEESYHALEDAGYAHRTSEIVVGVFGSAGPTSYWIDNLAPSVRDADSSFELMVGNDKDYLATRTAYKLNCRGPAYTVQAACSGSLVAVQQGYTNLLNYQCDLALCGGVSVTVPYRHGYTYREGHIFSADGSSRPFDAAANGTVFSEGVGVVVLKRLDEALADRDRIYGVILGAAVTNDGSRKVGFTAPSVQGQVEAIRRAQKMAGVSPGSIGYLEAHGTGTALGDPIEFAALQAVFPVDESRRNYCAIGSVKANIGHADSAAGIAGFVKSILVLNRRRIPVLTGFERSNPAIDVEESAFTFPTKSSDWIGGPRRAGVTSLGVGGTNVHVVLEEAPSTTAADVGKRPELLLFSARSEPSLERTSTTIRDSLTGGDAPTVHDAAFTLATARPFYAIRSFAVLAPGGTSPDGDDPFPVPYQSHQATSQKTVLMFSGQGAQYACMGRDLYASLPEFAAAIDECASALSDISSLDLRSLLFSDPSAELDERLRQTAVTQPVLFSLEYALGRQILSWGVKPSMFIGHSLGEYTAACLSGVLTLSDAIGIVTARGSLMQSADPGTMMAINASRVDVEQLLIPHVEVCVENGPTNTVIGGETGSMEAMVRILADAGLRAIPLKTSHAFHSASMDPILEQFRAHVERAALLPPAVPIVSNVTGRILSDAEAVDPAYWVSHIRSTVRFYSGLRTLMDDGATCFIEVGPGTTLTSLARRAKRPDDMSVAAIPTMRRADESVDDRARLLAAIGEYWSLGGAIDAFALFRHTPGRRTWLPGYAFDRDRYWIDASPIGDQGYREAATPATNVAVDGEYGAFVERVREVWSAALGIHDFTDDVDFHELGGDSVASIRVIELLNRSFGTDLPPNQLFVTPTVSTLARAITDQVRVTTVARPITGASIPLLFPVRANGGRLPLFLVPGAHENRYFDTKRMTNSYQDDLIRYLSSMLPHFGADQPVYGFRPRGIIAWETPRTSVRSMAGDFIAEMKRVQPIGPYILVGECVGGIVAYEMARQLVASGDEVRALILMDTWRPTWWTALNERLAIRRHLFVRGLRQLVSVARGPGIAKIASTIKDGFTEARYLLLPIGRRAREQRRLRNGSYAYERVLLEYRPERLNVRTHIIANTQWNAERPGLGWDDDTLPDRALRVVPGNHVSRVRDYGHLSGEYIRGIVSGAGLGSNSA